MNYCKFDGQVVVPRWPKLKARRPNSWPQTSLYSSTVDHKSCSGDHLVRSAVTPDLDTMQEVFRATILSFKSSSAKATANSLGGPLGAAGSAANTTCEDKAKNPNE